MFSFVNILSTLFLCYVLHSLYSLCCLYFPPKCLEDDFKTSCFVSYLSSRSNLSLFMFVSTSKKVDSDARVKLVYKSLNFDYNSPINGLLNLTLPSVLHQRRASMFLHAIVSDSDQLTDVKAADDIQLFNTLMHVPYDSGRRRFTLSSVTYATVSLLVNRDQFDEGHMLMQSHSSADYSRSDKMQTTKVLHTRSIVSFVLLSDRSNLKIESSTADLVSVLRSSPNNRYLPLFQLDTISERSKDFVKSTNMSDFSLSFAIRPITLGELRFRIQISMAFASMIKLGFTETDLDDMRSILTGTNFILFLLTTVVASLHLLFDLLAFKSDIQFWRARNSFVGISTHTVVWRAVSQFIILLYLIDQKTSYLVIVPMCVGVLIEIWKVFRSFRITFTFSTNYRECIVFGARESGEISTSQFDTECMRKLSYLLYPLCVSGAIYSLLYNSHKSWYSWLIQSAVNGVYAFGFLFMLPQLFVNYKLKSVAHLPWRALMYKAFNTFIDDLFAFIITMPTAHRLACFRDDLVFLVYLGQRYLYPVDSKRVDVATDFTASSEVVATNKKRD